MGIEGCPIANVMKDQQTFAKTSFHTILESEPKVQLNFTNLLIYNNLVIFLVDVKSPTHSLKLRIKYFKCETRYL